MYTLAEIAASLDGRLEGDGDLVITHACEVEGGTPGGITFITAPKYRELLADSQASAVLAYNSMDTQGMPTIRVENPALAMARVLALLTTAHLPQPGIHPSAVIGDNVELGQAVSIGPHVTVGDESRIGDGVILGAGVVLGRNVELGARVRLHPRVVLYDSTVIGEATLIHAGTVIGSDGFGFVTVQDVHHKIPHGGRVIIGRNVEIGANCTMDRGSVGDTVIGDDCKFDNLVQVAHNVKIGRGCLIAGETGIAGSTTLGDFVTIGAQVGVAGHIHIGDHVQIGGKSGVRQSLKPGKTYVGDPAVEYAQWLRQIAAQKRLPELVHRVRDLENKISSHLP